MQVRFIDERKDPNEAFKNSEFKKIAPIPVYNKGTFSIKNAGPEYANAIRRVLLDELPTETLHCNENSYESDDKNINEFGIYNIINQIKVLKLSSHKYALSVKSGESDYIPIFSDSIISNGKPAEVEKGILICHLSPGRYLRITNIETQIGTGRTHARFSAVQGNVSYKELDFAYIYFLNERGFIEQNKKKVFLKSLKNYKDLNKVILSNKEYEKLLNKKDAKYFKLLEPVYEAEFAGKARCKNFELSFKSVFPARQIAKSVFSELLVLLKLASEAEVSTISDVTSFRFKGSATIGNLLFHTIKADCTKSQEVQSGYKFYKLSVRHPDAEKLFQAAIKEVSDNLSNAFED